MLIFILILFGFWYHSKQKNHQNPKSTYTENTTKTIESGYLIFKKRTFSEILLRWKIFFGASIVILQYCTVKFKILYTDDDNHFKILIRQ